MNWICSHCGEKFSRYRTRCSADGQRVIEDLSGQLIGGRYRVRELIGVGGMDSTVWKAWQTGTERVVAVKVLPAPEEAAAKRFARGARIAANLNHPNCTVVHDYGQTEDGKLFLVMEYLAGQVLQELLGPEGMAPPDAIHIAIQVLQALEHAHGERAVHRDLKPDNLFLIRKNDDPLHVKILDFGIAKYVEEDPEATSSTEDDKSADDFDDLVTEQRQVCGTPQYMAPEQVVGARVDGRTDLYALGCVLYRMLTGRLPFDGKTRYELYQKHLQEVPKPFHEVRPDLAFPDRLELIVMKALAKRPDQRFQGASEMRKALESIELTSDRQRRGTRPRVALKNTSPQERGSALPTILPGPAWTLSQPAPFLPDAPASEAPPPLPFSAGEVGQPGLGRPSAGEVGQPGLARPSAGQPGLGRPSAVEQPGLAKPAAGQHVGQPGLTRPSGGHAGQPGLVRPASGRKPTGSTLVLGEPGPREARPSSQSALPSIIPSDSLVEPVAYPQPPSLPGVPALPHLGRHEGLDAPPTDAFPVPETGEPPRRQDLRISTNLLSDAVVRHPASRSSLVSGPEVPRSTETEPNRTGDGEHRRRRWTIFAVLAGAFLVGVGGVALVMKLTQSEATEPMAEGVAVERDLSREARAGAATSAGAAATPAIAPQTAPPVTPSAPPTEAPREVPTEAGRVAGLALSDAPIEPPRPAMARVSIESTPPGAVVREGVEILGPTPLSTSLLLGHHTLVVDKPGFLPQTLELELGPAPDAVFTRAVVLEPRPNERPAIPGTTPKTPGPTFRPIEAPRDVPRDPGPKIEAPPQKVEPKEDPKPKGPQVKLLEDGGGAAPVTGPGKKPTVKLLDDEEPQPKKPQVKVLDE